jgi:hypothetical protein
MCGQPTSKWMRMRSLRMKLRSRGCTLAHLFYFERTQIPFGNDK